jgi:hypothetical protein
MLSASIATRGLFPGASVNVATRGYFTWIRVTIVEVDELGRITRIRAQKIMMERARQEDNEILEIIAIVLKSGVLD